MPLRDWIILFEKEGIDPKTDVPNSDRGFHFTKTTLICRGGQYLVEEGYGDEEENEARMHRVISSVGWLTTDALQKMTKKMWSRK